jgi:RHS repeat-associated protein
MVVKVDYTEPDLRCDLAHGSGNDPYDGLDRFDRVVDLLWRDYGASVDVERVKHGYDRASNRLWRESAVAAGQNPAVHMDELYTYDGVYQLKTFKRGDLNATRDAIVTGTLKFAQEWSFDATGNWTNFKEDATGDGTFELDQNRTHNKFNEITQIAASSSHIAHDRAGNTTIVPKPNDWNAHHDNIFDAWDREVTVKDGANKVTDNGYDALNRRTLKKVYTAGTLTLTRHYYYSDQWQILEESKDLNTLPDRQFVWGRRYLDDLILRDRDADGLSATGNLGITGSGLEERLYCVQDANWNVTAVADATGDVRERFTYAAFGKPSFLTAVYTSLSESSYDWETLFAGYRFDKESGSYNQRHRDLESPLGRWGTRDPIARQELLSRTGSISANLYVYASGNPLNRLDPTGMDDVTYTFGGFWANCPVHDRVGHIFVDCSCKGLFGLWVVPEDSDTKAFSPKCGKWYRADGFVYLGTVAKIDGSTCIVLKCQRVGFKPCRILVLSRIECTMSFAIWLAGKKCPYRVERGHFKNEPKTDEISDPVEEE